MHSNVLTECTSKLYMSQFGSSQHSDAIPYILKAEYLWQIQSLVLVF